MADGMTRRSFMTAAASAAAAVSCAVGSPIRSVLAAKHSAHSAIEDKEEEMYKELFMQLCSRRLEEIDDDQVTELGGGIFSGCENLRSVRMSAVTSINNTRRSGGANSELFYFCPKLEVVDFPSLVSMPGYSTMFGMSNSSNQTRLTLINLPSLRSIGNYSFQYIGDSDTFDHQITLNLDSCQSLSSLAFTRTGHLDIHIPLFSTNDILSHASFPFSGTNRKTTNRFFCADGMVSWNGSEWVVSEEET